MADTEKLGAREQAERMIFHRFYEDEGVDKICIIGHKGYGGYWSFDVDLHSGAIEAVRNIIADALEAYADHRTAELRKLVEFINNRLTVIQSVARDIKNNTGGRWIDQEAEALLARIRAEVTK